MRHSETLSNGSRRNPQRNEVATPFPSLHLPKKGFAMTKWYMANSVHFDKLSDRKNIIP